MRVGIDYHFLAQGRDLITRGVSRYTQSQLRAVLGAGAGNEYVLVCSAAADLSLIAPDIRDADNVEIRCYTPPSEADWPPWDEPGRVLRRAEHFQDWIHRLGIDLYHATAPLMLDGPPLVRFDACPMVATLYDLIPLRFPDQYLDPFGTRDRYLQTLNAVKGADRLLAISDSAGDDAVSMLGIEPDRIDRAWPVPDEAFRRLPAAMLRKRLLVMAGRVRIPERYLLTVSHIHHTKNLETLLRGYALLPEALRASFPLVVCCHLDPPALKLLRDVAEHFGVLDDLVITGRVSDDELCALYNQATLVVHPSRWEGFGFPVAEAMACGTPVMTTTASSLPEVAGDAAVLVDPEDAEGFALAIAALVRDGSARAAMVQRGFAQVTRFSSGQLATATLESYARAVAGRGEVSDRPGQARRRVAIWTPLPPQETGIADYAAELLAGLDPQCELEIFVDDGHLPAADLLERYTVQHFTAFDRRAAQKPFDAVVYQVGASPYHLYMADALAAHPGIVVLHDLMWSNVLYTAYCEWWNDAATFNRLLSELHGEAAVRELRDLDVADKQALWDFFHRYPMLEPVIARALAVVVHVERAAEELRAAHPDVRTWVVPMGVADPTSGNPAADRAAARVGLGLDPDGFVVGTYGIAHPVKRVEVCLRAMADLLEDHPGATFLVVGQSLDTYVGELMALAERLGIEGSVRFTGRVTRESLEAYLAAADVVVNLRTPGPTHMSAILMRAIAAGKPTLISDLPGWRDLPEAICRRIPVDGTEAQVLAGELRLLASDPQLRAGMSAAARAFYEQEGTSETMAARYLDAIERVLTRREALGEDGAVLAGAGPPSGTKR